MTRDEYVKAIKFSLAIGMIAIGLVLYVIGRHWVMVETSPAKDRPTELCIENTTCEGRPSSGN